VLNGDTFLIIDAKMVWDFAKKKNADIVIALKYMETAERFGKVHIDQAGRIIKFEEKGSASEGLINSGFYYVHESCFAHINKEAFSFEDEILASNSMGLSIYGLETSAYFLDMGIPEDLSRGHLELPNEI
jgi:NDP-sugar pyrophosphorylase family protein